MTGNAVEPRVFVVLMTVGRVRWSRMTVVRRMSMKWLLSQGRRSHGSAQVSARAYPATIGSALGQPADAGDGARRHHGDDAPLVEQPRRPQRDGGAAAAVADAGRDDGDPRPPRGERRKVHDRRRPDPRPL